MARKLTPEEKTARKRIRLTETIKRRGTRKYISECLAPLFQKMIRAEAAAEPDDYTPVLRHGELIGVRRRTGFCACITCGRVVPWSTHSGDMQTGHFLGSRCNSILFDEENVAPQCTRCNNYGGGAPQEYRRWMVEVRGEETVERLERLKATTRSFDRKELVDMRIEYGARLKAAETRLNSQG